MADSFATIVFGASILILIGAVLGFVAFSRTTTIRLDLERAYQRIIELEESVYELKRARFADAAEALGPDSVAEGAEPAPPTTSDEPAAAPEPNAAPPRQEPAPEPALEARAEAAPAAPRIAEFERLVTANWLVWAGGVMIALAIIFLLGFAIQEGYFGPPAQLAAAYLLGAGLIGAAEWVRRSPPPAAFSHSLLAHLPSILAGAGLFAFFAATYAGYASFKIVPGALALILMVASSLAAVFAAMHFGRWLAALGLTGGYLAPGLVHFSHPSPAALFGYLLLLTVSVLAIIRIRRWPGFVWLAALGALIWGVIWIAGETSDFAAREAAYYLVALVGVGFWFGWDEARAPLSFASWWRLRASWTEPVFAAHAIAAAAGIILVGIIIVSSQDAGAVAALIALCALLCLAAAYRESFALAPLGAAVLAVATILTWDSAFDDLPLRVPQLFTAAGALGFIFTAGGWVMMTLARVKGPGATLAALGGVSILMALHDKAGPLESPVQWGAMAAALTLINVFALNRVVSLYGGVDAAPGPSAAFSLGAAAGAILTILYALDGQGLWRALALAALAPALAALDVRFRLPALRFGASIAALLAAWRLGPSLSVFGETVAGPPLLNALAPVYGLSALALWGAGWLYRRGGVDPEARVVQALEASALIVIAFGVAAAVRQLARGALDVPGMSLFEVAGDAIAFLGLAIGLATRFGPRPRLVLFIAETAVLAFALGLLFWGGLVWLNPWWGVEPAAAPGAPVVNLLLASFGVPAALLAAYAIIRRRQGLRDRAMAAGAIATFLAFINVTLEVRRLFHGPRLQHWPIGAWETWAYSAAWVVFAGAVLALGLMRGKPSLRYASLAVLLFTVAKVIMLDLTVIDGVLRAGLLLGVGLFAIGVTLVYQRFVFTRSPRSGPVDPNLTPPAPPL